MIKKGNLAASLMAWLMNTLQLGPGIGDVYYLCVQGSNYHLWLLSQKIPTDHICFTLVAAEDRLTDARNDVLCVFPGGHVQTAQLTWDKNQTHMVCLGGPNLRVQPTALTTGGLRFETSTTAVPYLFNITGNYCQFHGLGTFNNGAATSNLGDIAISGKNNFFKRCDLRGGNTQLQNEQTTPYAGVPVVFKGGTGFGNGTTFEECQIGSAGNYKRTHGPGGVLFLGGVGSQCFDVVFRKCIMEMWTETLGSDVGMIMLASTVSPADRFVLIEDCLVYNFWTNHVDKANYAIVEPSGSPTTHDIILKRSTLAGFDFWSNNATFVLHDMPDVADGGGVVEGVKIA